MVTILMISTKLATPDLLQKYIFWNKGYDVITPDYETINKIFSYDSNYIL